jgi:hypothetical protein
VHAASGRRRGRAQVDALERRPVRDEAPYRAEEELAEIHRAAVEISADEVAVMGLEVGRAERAASEDQVAEARREALDLGLDALRHVHVGAVRDMAVGPGGVIAGRRARLVPEARLGEQDERTLSDPARPGEPLGARDLLERASEVDGGRPPARLRLPRDRAREGPVELERPRTVPVAEQRLLVRVR